MIRMVQNRNSKHAKKYFSDALSKSDYYIDDQELSGHFFGKLAKRIGLNGIVTKDSFFALCENRHPIAGTPLTPHTKEKRTVGYDINFHCPKGVSLAHALSEKNDILEIFEKSTQETMLEIETDTRTRVRVKDKDEDRITGELVWARFVHKTARPVNDLIPDPHLHAHCFVFNSTWDETEQKIKAAQFRQIKQRMPYYQARFHKRLADKLIESGYELDLSNGRFDLKSIPAEVRKHFSKRTNEIGQIAKDKNITDPDELGSLGAKTRSKKKKGLSMAELRKDWLKQIEALGIEFDASSLKTSKFALNERVLPNCKTIINQAISHSFERASVVNERKLLQEAFRFAIGNEKVTLQEIEEYLATDNRIIRMKHGEETLCTTREVLNEEREMVDLARAGIGKVRPLSFNVQREQIDQQQKAINEILTTTNRCTIIRGAAGSGKTTLMKKAIAAIEQSGKTVTVVAPTATAARGVLRSEGHTTAETVAQLLSDKTMQEKLKNNVLWVDEAGIVGTKDMLALLKLTTKQNARLVLGGDTRQHSSVIRGDALRVLNTVAKIPTAEINVIRRQQNEVYRTAVEDLSNGDIAQGFDKLDKMGAIKMINKQNPNKDIMAYYAEAIFAGRSVLAVSPTHEQGERLTVDIRKLLKDLGSIGETDIEIPRLINRNFTEAEKSDIKSFSKGQAIQFNMPAPGLERGSSWLIDAINGNDVVLTNKNGDKRQLPIDLPDRYDVFEVSKMSLSRWDKVRVTRNSFESKATVEKQKKIKGRQTKKPKRMDNGLVLEVIAINKNGSIKLRNPQSKTEYRINKDFGHITHDYCVTSHSAQGKTVDEVLIMQPSETFGATNAKQFYVSVSRGKHSVHVFTDDREALLDHAKHVGDRVSALELMQKSDNTTEIVLQQKRYQQYEQEKYNDLSHSSYHKRNSRGYEPSI